MKNLNEKENALKKEICEAFNIQNPNATVYKHDHIRLGWDFFYTNFISVKQVMDVSNVSKQYNKAEVLTHFIYKFKDGRKVDLLPLLFGKDELMSYVGVSINYDDTDTLTFHSLDDNNVFTEVSVHYVHKMPVLRKNYVYKHCKSGVNIIINGYEEHSWLEKIKEFDDNEVVVDLESGIKSKQVKIIETVFDNQLVR